jgi:hypothetical protein
LWHVIDTFATVNYHLLPPGYATGGWIEQIGAILGNPTAVQVGIVLSSPVLCQGFVSYQQGSGRACSFSSRRRLI